MYIIRNAFKSIGRSRGRNILIGVIVLVIAISACLGLSIRQAAENAKAETLEGLSVTATISFDRKNIMNEMMDNMQNGGENQDGGRPSFDRNQFSEAMGENSALSLEEYKKYATADSVKDFYYTISASLNGTDAFLPVSNDVSDNSETSGSMDNGAFSNGFGGKGGNRNQMFGAQSDFSIIGYSEESAMTAFVNGTATIVEGAVFTEGTEEMQCIISKELATYNSIAVGDTITLENPNNESETYQFTVVGIYTDSSANENSFSIMGATSTDPANSIYMSYNALNSVVTVSKNNAVTETDENTGREFSSEINSSVNATYVFEDVESYNRFTQQVKEMGLDDNYTVSSSDLTAYESSLVPLQTLSKMAGYFLIVVLIIGAIILIVLNIFNIRERKYEIGVLTAMGMKKGKVALQFLTEIFIVTLIAVIIGATIGGVTAVPVTNALLENQVSAQTNRSEQIEQNFGRPEGFGGGNNMPQMDEDRRPDNFFGDTVVGNYISEIDSAMNLTVVFQMLGIAILLTVISGAVAMLFVMRYDPLRILANRD